MRAPLPYEPPYSNDVEGDAEEVRESRQPVVERRARGHRAAAVDEPLPRARRRRREPRAGGAGGKR
jgi:hypothetical protein